MPLNANPPPDLQRRVIHRTLSKGVEFKINRNPYPIPMGLPEPLTRYPKESL